jgi:very-short-patch-repair endonuclease
VKPQLRSQAKRLRRAMTPAERKLWHALKAHRFQALHIRRQVPMGSYVADFICHAAKIVIEVDGAQHGFDQHLERDRARDAWFEAQGYRVLRFWNHDVLTGLDSVLDTIFANIPSNLPIAGDTP